jgi:hypothetical protein
MKSTMFKAALACGTALFLAGAPMTVSAQNQPTLVIQGATLIDGNGGAPVANANIVVTGNRITAAGRNVRVPAGAQVINAQGKWVVPGLIDAKGNWNWNYGEPNLVWGVTSVMVSGGRNNQGFAERDAINRGVFRGPRLYTTGVTLAGAGPMNNRPDNYRPGDGNRIIKTPEEAVAHVRAMVEAGADIITFQNGDGDYAAHDAAVKEAQRLGKGIDFRGMGPRVRAREICEMGSGIVYVHTGNVGAQIAKDETKYATYIALPPDQYADMDDAKATAMIQHLVRCNAYLEPDLMATGRGFHKNWARVQQENRDFMATLPAYYPKHSSLGVIENAKSPDTYLNPMQLQVRAAGFKNHATFLKRFVDAGGHLVAASDNPQTHPGLGTHQELTAFVEDVGLTPMQGIQSATSWVADGFKIADIGRIAPGKFADMVVLDADPLQNILNLRRINTVIKDGKVVDRNYDPKYGDVASMFQNRRDEDYDINLGGADWAAANKEANWNANTRNGGFGNAGGIDSEKAATPGIEAFAPHTVLRGSPDTVVKLTGYNFYRTSKVYVDGREVPTKVNSRTEIEATIPAAVLANAGKLDIVVKNPQPITTPVWGDTSNIAHLLVPYEFTKVLPQPRW